MATEFRVLVAPEGVDPTDLGALYRSPAAPWFRANMVSTINGVAAGPDGRSGSINNDIDRQVFALLRSQADAILVGAGTARTEGYQPTDRPIVIVTKQRRDSADNWRRPIGFGRDRHPRTARSYQDADSHRTR